MNRKNEPGFLLNVLPLQHAGQPVNVLLRACQALSGAGQPNLLFVDKITIIQRNLK
jgi:hypothetical protein